MKTTRRKHVWIANCHLAPFYSKVTCKWIIQKRAPANWQSNCSLMKIVHHQPDQIDVVWCCLHQISSLKLPLASSFFSEIKKKKMFGELFGFLIEHVDDLQTFALFCIYSLNSFVVLTTTQQQIIQDNKVGFKQK